MALTYEPIATTSIGSPTTTITFSSIPSTYTDLRISAFVQSSSGSFDFRIRFNGDTGNNYSGNFLYANVDGFLSRVVSNNNEVDINNFGGGVISTQPCSYLLDIFSYSNTSINKTFYSKNNNEYNTGTVGITVGLWRNTSAINSITLYSGNTNNFNTNSTITLYGIKAA